MKKGVSIGIILTLTFSFLLVSVTFAYSPNWITPERIGNPNAKIVLHALLGREDTLYTPYASRKAYVEKAYERWARRNPDVQIIITPEIPGQISSNMAKLLTQIEAGQGPDLASVDSFWIGTFIAKGAVQPLDQFMTKEERDTFFNFTKDVTVANGHQYAIWAETDARYLFYRKDWIKTPPRTWDQLIQTALKMKKEHHVYGFLTDAGHWEGAANENTWPYFWAQGGRIFDKSGKPIFGEGKNKEIMLNILNFDKRLVESGAAPQMISSITGFDPILAEVKANKVAMFIDGNWAINQVHDIVKDADQKWAIAPYPQMKADQRGNSNGGWTQAIITKDPVKQAAAFNFIWEVYGSELAMAKRCALYNYMPTREDVYKDFSFYTTNPLQQFFAESLKYGRARPASTLYPIVSDLMQTAVGNVLLGVKSPEQAIDEAYAKALKTWKERK